jgi:hypothetical protein
MVFFKLLRAKQLTPNDAYILQVETISAQHF